MEVKWPGIYQPVPAELAPAQLPGRLYLPNADRPLVLAGCEPRDTGCLDPKADDWFLNQLIFLTEKSI